MVKPDSNKTKLFPEYSCLKYPRPKSAPELPDLMMPGVEKDRFAQIDLSFGQTILSE